ncbi:MAG: acetyl-CoA carboxylase biotin carboxyl carrier protein, partial [Endomicrobiia bacterium]
VQQMETKEIKKFIDLIKDTDIEELQWESGDIKITIKRQEIEKSFIPEKTIEEVTTNKEVKKEKQFLSIKSPMVGIFYRAQSSDHPPLVMEGNHVVQGQKVAVIEALKIMKDVVSDVKGKIVKILVEDGTPVEYGQELFLVEPEEKS